MFKRGGIYSINLPRTDSKDLELCPCLVVSNNISNEFSQVLTIIPLNFSNLDKIYDFETFLPARGSGLSRDAKISAHLLITINKSNVIGERLGFINKTIVSKLNRALCLQLGIDETN